jgi:NAD(P)-dependent dehydrogenase (short-subunit alcohol dehydrogenase family)
MSREELAVIIGAGGIGTAVARRLSQRYRVLLADLDGERAASGAVMLSQEGGKVAGVKCDVTSAISVRQLAQQVQDQGGLRVLAQVAGLSPTMGDFDRIIRVNLVGPALVTEALLPHANPGAAAIMISSLAAHLGTFPEAVMNLLRESAASIDLPNRLRMIIGDEQATANAAYQLSKFGLLMLCRRRASNWGARQGRIVSLSPGMIATPMGAREFELNPSKRQMFELSPQKREGTMNEIADVVEFLASDRASFISGTDILVDGGLAGAISDVPFGGRNVVHVASQ